MSITAAPPSISTTGIRKAYGGEVVLDGIDLSVPRGTIFALLGPNGAGKTTIVRILSTLIPPDAGTGSVDGHDLVHDAVAVRRSIGVTGQFSAVDNLLTGRENLQLMADLHHLDRQAGRARVNALLEKFDLVDAAARTPDTYSGGMRRRLDLAMTLVGDPRVIFLDEPTTGLDPRTRQTMWQVIRELASDGVTILLTTQHLEEADQLADRIAVVDGGRLVAVGTASELKRLIPGGHLLLTFAEAYDLDRAATLLPGSTPDHEALTLHVPSDGALSSLRAVLDRLGDSVDVADLSIHTPDLDDVFFALTSPRKAG